MDKVTFYSSEVILSEEQNDPDFYIAKFVICDFGRNLNGCALNRETIDTWLSTLIDKPLVGKITMKADGSYDFTGHNVKIVTKHDSDGNVYKEMEFDTSSFGFFKSVGIEIINNKECIVATCKIWKRFTKACDVIINRIKEGTLHTSWEIATESTSKGIVDGFVTKVINVGRFIGHCLLGSDIPPAYNSSGLLEIASTQYDTELAEALSHDLTNNKELSLYKAEAPNKENIAKEDTMDKEELKDKAGTPTDTNTVDAPATENQPTEQSVTNDTENQTPESSEKHKDEDDVNDDVNSPDEDTDDEKEKDKSEDEAAKKKRCSELESDVAKLNARIAELETLITEKDELILKAGKEITELNSTISGLTPFKEKFEKAEQERIEREQAEKRDSLVASITSSGVITKEEIETSEELSGYVQALDKKSLMAIVGERMTASIKENQNSADADSAASGFEISSNELNDNVSKAKAFRHLFFAD